MPIVNKIANNILNFMSGKFTVNFGAKRGANLVFN